MDILHHDPAAALKWLAIFLALGALYFQLRRWEKTLTGKIERIEVQAPIEVIPGKEPVTRSTLDPVIRRVGELETEVRVIRAKMEADKIEILSKIDALKTTTQDGFRSLERAIGRLEGSGS